MQLNLAIALNRFGLGARPDEPFPSSPKAWLLDQLQKFDPIPPAWAQFPNTRKSVGNYLSGLRTTRAATGAERMDLGKTFRNNIRLDYTGNVQARMAAALDTTTPFVERLVHFWANHFAISVEKPDVRALAGSFERDAIRPNVLGSFEDMLVAVVQHPAMLRYLDQTRSIGPSSQDARRIVSQNAQRTPGLNENLAREIMELHTLGVRSGYTQADVTEFARALTGWGVRGFSTRAKQLDAPDVGAFEFSDTSHEPGSRTVLGKSYEPGGERQGRAILHDLASSQATAKHIATKLARHFIADNPPQSAIARLAKAFGETNGDLSAVYRALIETPESWAPGSTKFKTPWDWLVSTLRGFERSELGEIDVMATMAGLGQKVWLPGSPAGFDDFAQSWAAPDALMRRLELAQRMASSMKAPPDPRALAPRLLPENLSKTTAEMIDRAESRPAGIALLIMSPEFQRR